MNNSIKLLLFTLVSLASCATLAMGALRNFGTRLLKGTAVAAPTYGGLHSAYYVATKKEPTVEEMIEENKRYFAQVEQCPMFQQRLKKLKESSKLKKQLGVPKGNFAKHIVPLFTELKNQNKKLKNIPLVTSTELGCGLTYNCKTCNHRLVIIDPEYFSDYDNDVRKFILAHELGHHHEDHLLIRDEDLNAPSDICHAQEYQADEYAARSLGSIQGALTWFDAHEQVDGKVAFNSWIGSVANYFSEGKSHPSHEKRVARLFALKKAGILNTPYAMQTYKKNPELITTISA